MKNWRDDYMDITAFVLIIRLPDGSLKLGEGRQGICDLPVGFEPNYADFLFEFAESRIRCHPDDEILLAKGSINTDDIEQSDRFIEAFKRRLQSECDFSNWQIMRSKKALGINDNMYQQKLLHHLRERHARKTERRDNAQYSATG